MQLRRTLVCFALFLVSAVALHGQRTLMDEGAHPEEPGLDEDRATWDIMPTLELSLTMAAHWSAFCDLQDGFVADLPDPLPMAGYHPTLVGHCQRALMHSWKYTAGAWGVFLQNGYRQGDFEVAGAMLSITVAWRNAVAAFGGRHPMVDPLVRGSYVQTSIDVRAWREYYLCAADEAIDRARIVLDEGLWKGKRGAEITVFDGSKFSWPSEPGFPFPDDFRWFKPRSGESPALRPGRGGR